MAHIEGKVKNTSLTTRFIPSSSDDEFNGSLVIEGHGGYIKSGDGLPFRCYPYDPDTNYDASYGDVVSDGTNYEDRIFEVVNFQSSTEASFSKFPKSIESFTLMGKIIAAEGDEAQEDIGGRFIRNNGKIITVNFDPEKGVLRASAPCFATFKCFYISTYELIRYTAEVTSVINSVWWGRIANGYTYGTIVAQLGKAYATFDVQPPTTEILKRTTELFRVTTQAVANEAGLWELPDSNWDVEGQTPVYTLGGGSVPDPDDGYQVNSRVHMVGTINLNGIIHIDEYRIPQADGPSLTNWVDTQAVYTAKKHTAELKNDDLFKAAVDWITSTDIGLIDQRLEKFPGGLTWDNMP